VSGNKEDDPNKYILKNGDGPTNFRGSCSAGLVAKADNDGLQDEEIEERRKLETQSCSRQRKKHCAYYNISRRKKRTPTPPYGIKDDIICPEEKRVGGLKEKREGRSS